MSVAGPPSPSGPVGPGRPPAPRRSFQPIRAAAVIFVSVGVGIAVLARMGGTPTTASTTTTTRPTTSSVTTTTALTSTTVPTTTTTTIAPHKVTVLVLNGGTTLHAALYFQTELSADGYDTLAPNNATTSALKLSEIFVVKPSAQANAAAIAGILKASPSSVLTPTAANDGAVPTSMINSADVIVVVGADISGQVPPHFETTTTAAG
jgi:LytR cell envelope-related transcriptional attenuator